MREENGALVPSWFLDELAHAGAEHVDQAYAGAYDRKSPTDWTGELELLRRLGMNGRSTLVDLGAGTGAFALAAAPLCRRVVAVDVSPAMLAVIRAEAARRGIAGVECVQAGFLSYEHQGDPADVVYTRNALHHLPDFWKALALRRIAAVLRTGGVLRLRDLVVSSDLAQVEQDIEAWLAGAPARSEVGWTRPEYEVHLREEYSTFSWLLEPMLERAGFRVDSAEYSDSRIFAAYTCVKI
jgi:SAM-dependent methyltransferase